MNTIEPKAVQATTQHTEHAGDAARAAKVRAAMTGQAVAAKRQETELRFGRIYSRRDLVEAVRQSVPMRLFRQRAVEWERLENYTRFVPDAALLRYQEAYESGLFVAYSVLWPTYAARPAKDPWLVGWVNISLTEGVVLAYWDDAALHPARVAPEPGA